MPRRCLAFAVAIALIAFAASCGDVEPDGDETPAASPPPTTGAGATPTSEPSPARTSTPAPTGDDLGSLPALQDFVAQQGGEIIIARTIYADLTGDGTKEAIVPVSSGGETLGDIAIFVVGQGPDGLEELLRALPPQEARGGHIEAGVESGQLVISWPIYGPDDANCCPSGGSRVRYYRWDGSALVIDREVVGTPES